MYIYIHIHISYACSPKYTYSMYIVFSISVVICKIKCDEVWVFRYSCNIPKSTHVQWGKQKFEMLTMQLVLCASSATLENRILCPSCNWMDWVLQRRPCSRNSQCPAMILISGWGVQWSTQTIRSTWRGKRFWKSSCGLSMLWVSWLFLDIYGRVEILAWYEICYNLLGPPFQSYLPESFGTSLSHVQHFPWIPDPRWWTISFEGSMGCSF